MNRENWAHKYYYDVAYKNKVLVQVQLELLTKCNLRCRHCYLPQHSNAGMSTNKVKTILKELRQLGTLSITFTGGEIFLREDILDLVECARGLYMRVSLLTNATCITEEQIKKLAKLHIADISTTIFSMNEDIHDSITQVKGSLKRLLHNLELLKRNNIRVQIKVPVMNMNFKTVDGVYEYCISNGFMFSASPIINVKLDGDDAPKSMRLDETCLRCAVKQIDEMENYMDYHRYISKKYDTICSTLNYSITIDSFGNVYPCTAFTYKIGSLDNNTVTKIWKQSKELQYLRSIKKCDLDKCLECIYEKYCERCPGVSLTECGDLLSCDILAKSVAAARYDIYER